MRMALVASLDSNDIPNFLLMMILIMVRTNMMTTNAQVLVTDAIAGLGLKEGDTFKSGQQKAEVDIL